MSRKVTIEVIVGQAPDTGLWHGEIRIPGEAPLRSKGFQTWGEASLAAEDAIKMTRDKFGSAGFPVAEDVIQ